MNNNGVMICPKCGNEMKSNDRFCFHCGYINYDNNSNDFLVKYDKKAQKLIKKENKKAGKKEPTNKFFNVRIEEQPKAEEKKFYRSIEEYRETVDKNVEKTASEKANSLRYNITQAVITIGFIGMLFFGYRTVVAKQKVYVEQANEIVSLVKKKYGNNHFKACTRSDKYLFSFTSESLKTDYNVDIVSPYISSKYSGYVLVTNVSGKYVYSISMTDGTFGIREKNIEEVTTKNVLPYYKLTTPSISTNCK